MRIELIITFNIHNIKGDIIKKHLFLISLLAIALISMSSIAATELSNDTISNGDMGIIDDELMTNDDVGREIVTDDSTNVEVLKTDESSQDNIDFLSGCDEPLMDAENDAVLENSTPDTGSSNHFGYWSFARDMNDINFTEAANNGVTDIFLNFYAYTIHNKTEIETWIANASEKGIRTHIWTQIFWEGEWTKPINDGVINQTFFDEKIAELVSYADTVGLYGIHFDYLRFSGSPEFAGEDDYDRACDNPGGMEAISEFVRQAKNAIKAVNPNLKLSSAVCPAIEHLEDWFGCNYSSLTSNVDIVLPMLYIGSFNEDSTWIYECGKWFVENSKGAEVWIGLLGYINDNNPKPVPLAEINNEIKTALDTGATGAIVFRYTLSENINFTDLTVDENELKSFKFLNYKIQSAVDELVLQNDYMYNETYDWDFMNGIVIDKSNFVIDGAGHTISGDSFANIFNIVGNNVTLKNINFVDALSIEFAAAANFNGNGSIINCNFTHISANLDGGAVYFNGTGIVENCNFNYNTVNRNGGCIYFNGTGYVKGSTFIQNVASGKGGVVYFAGRGIVENSNFYGNDAPDKGGAIFFDAEGIVKYSNFILNQATNGGGSIYFNTAGDVDHCMFNASSAERGGAIYSVGESVVNNTSFRLNIANIYGGAIYFETNSTVDNCIFDMNMAKNSYGAVSFSSEGTVKNSVFFDNAANAGTGAGAVHFGGAGIVDSCSFDNNSAVKGGAIAFDNVGFVNNSIFTNNKATVQSGGAISGFNYPLTITNSVFLNNKAKSCYMGYENNFKFIFTSYNNLIHAIYAQQCTFENVTYWNGNVVNSNDVAIIPNTFPGINVNIEVYDSNNVLVDNVTLVTNASSEVYYSPYHLDDGNYTIKAYHADDDYYYEYRSVLLEVHFTLNRTSSSVEINMANNTQFAYGDCSIGFNVVNRTEVRVVITDKNGRVLINETVEKDYVTVNLVPGDYNLTVCNTGNNITSPSADSKLFKINMASAAITAANKAYVINYGGKYSVTIKDAKDNVVAGQKVTFTLNGKNIGFAITDAKGVATVGLTAKILKAAKAGKKNLIIKLDSTCYQASKTVKITINKEKTKIVAKKKTFKKSQKVKKYTITLKNSKNKAVKKVQVTLKVKGKTYKAKTNAKGKATFKIKKLTKKGKFKATIKFKGNNCYKKATKKVKIFIK